MLDALKDLQNEFEELDNSFTVSTSAVLWSLSTTRTAPASVSQWSIVKSMCRQNCSVYIKRQEELRHSTTRTKTLHTNESAMALFLWQAGLAMQLLCWSKCRCWHCHFIAVVTEHDASPAVEHMLSLLSSDQHQGCRRSRMSDAPEAGFSSVLAMCVMQSGLPVTACHLKPWRQYMIAEYDTGQTVQFVEETQARSVTAFHELLHHCSV